MVSIADKLHGFYRAPASLAGYARPFAWVADARAAYRDGPIVDLGVADAFRPPPPALIAALRAVGGACTDHGYAFHRIAAFDDAALAFVRRRFGLDPRTPLRVLGTPGAKGGLALIAAALVAAGDLVLVTEPGYPIFALHAARLGATVRAVPAGDGLLAGLEALGPDVLDRAKVLAVNVPNNPTGTTLTPRALARLVALCARHDLVLVNDAAYASIVFAPERRVSLFQIEGADALGLEIHTLSKSLQIPGWRLGFVVGNPALLDRLERIALLTDSGQPPFLLRAAGEALGDDGYLDALNHTVERRLVRLVEILRRHGFDAAVPPATFFVYTPAATGVRDGARFASAHDAAVHLTSRHGVVAIPWDGPGHAGLRFSVAFPGDEDDTFARLDARLAGAGYSFEAAR